MVTVRGKRAIIDRRALAGALEGLGPAEPTSLRAKLVGRLKGALRGGQAEIRARLEAGGSGASLVAANSYLIDVLFTLLLDWAARRLEPAPDRRGADRFALIAVGGYGRAELAPYSDVDFLVLCPSDPTPWQKRIAGFVLYCLWDLGLKVGHAVRSVDETIAAAKDDMTIRTSLLEARRVWGDRALFETLRRRFAGEVVAGSAAEFIQAKLAERDARHLKTGDSRYVLEPNIKENKGALRDLHSLFWIAKYIYRVERFQDLVARRVVTAEEHRRFARCEDFLWRVRAHLHVVAGRAEERLSFDLQPAIARRMGFRGRSANSAVERFMKRYFLVAKDVGDLTRVLCAQLEAEHLTPGERPRAVPALPDGFTVEATRLSVADEKLFERRPVAIIELFRLAHTSGLDIHPRVIRLLHRQGSLVDRELRAEPEANRLFVEILTASDDPERTLRRMNEAGVLGRFLPDFGRIVGQVQHDMYHVYTVDEHTIRAIGILARIEQGELVDELPLASAIIEKVLSRRVLHLALLFHDIAKGRGGDHSSVGAKAAQRTGRRLGFSAEEVETVAWLVRHHLLFSNTAFKRDINDPKTVSDFVAIVQSLERLRLLLVLTVADIRAVGPKRWNAWRGTLLRELYARAEEVISGGHQALIKDERVRLATEALRRRLSGGPETDAYIARLHPPYWLSFDEDSHERHARLVERADRTGAFLTLDRRVDHFRGVTELTVYAADQPGFFAKVAGAIAVSGASIVDAKIFTTEDGMALDSFGVQDASGGAFDDEERLDRFAGLLEAALKNEVVLDDQLKRRRVAPRRSAVFPVESRVLIDNKASRRHTRIEINGRDRTGLLYDVTRALSELALTIVTAHVATFGERAVDVFYVTDAAGAKVTDEARLARIRARLLEALGGSAMSGQASPLPLGGPAG